MDSDKPELLIHIEYIREIVDRLDARLDTLNGQTRKNSEDIVVLKDRSEEARKAGQQSGLKWGAAGSALVGGLIAAAEHFTSK